jgi:hypothetical protein
MPIKGGRNETRNGQTEAGTQIRWSCRCPAQIVASVGVIRVGASAALIGAELVRWQVVAGIESMTTLLLVIFIVVVPLVLYFILGGEKRNDRDGR